MNLILISSFKPQANVMNSRWVGAVARARILRHATTKFEAGAVSSKQY